jgi:endoglucanase
MAHLQVKGASIVDDRGRAVRLRGVNLGNWLLLEGYMLAGVNEPEHRIRGSVAAARGESAARTFFRKYQDVYIQRQDLRLIKSWGFNVLRVPFNYRILDGNALHAGNGWRKLDWLAAECAKAGLYCVLDMHAAPGAQNHDWHSDSAALWTSARERRRMAELWGRIARRYKDAPAVAGYDILNEPITDDYKTLNALYRDCVAAVRDEGDRKIAFLEGPKYATDLEPLQVFDDPNLAYSVHFYEPHLFTFNWAMDLKYPGVIDGKKWDKKALDAILSRHASWARRHRKPILVGEFGVNTRCPCCHAEHAWVRDTLSLFERYGFHWTYWSYKVVSGHMHPGGLLRYTANPPWVNRHGVKIAWETYGGLSSKMRGEFVKSLDSRRWTADASLLAALRIYT